jgi:PiT family inorganic phosphate transporter
MTWELAMAIVLIAIALGFDFTNGFHDSSNAIATSVSTRAISLKVALIMAASLNFVGAYIGAITGAKVASTIQDVVPNIPTGAPALALIGGALIGAIGWNLLTWYFGIPSSSTHALIGAVAGSAIIGVWIGVAEDQVNWSVLLNKVIIPMITSPFVGLILAFILMRIIAKIFGNMNPQRVGRGFRHAQTVSAASMALGHGLQDAQKTMGIIMLILFSVGEAQKDSEPFLWVVVLCSAAIGLGTAAGGKKVMKTLGRRIGEIDPPRGFAAETVASGILYFTAYVVAAPVSTTQVITGSVMGAGAERRVQAVRWSVGKRILMAWIITLPGAAVFGAVAHVVISAIFGY